MWFCLPEVAPHFLLDLYSGILKWYNSQLCLGPIGMPLENKPIHLHTRKLTISAMLKTELKLKISAQISKTNSEIKYCFQSN